MGMRLRTRRVRSIDAHGADRWGNKLQSGGMWVRTVARKQAGVAGLLPLRDSGRLTRSRRAGRHIGIQGPFRVLARREEPPNDPGKVPGFVLGRTSPREVARSLCRDLHA